MFFRSTPSPKEPQTGTAEQNRALLLRWFDEVWNQGRESAIDELFAADGHTFGYPEPDSVDDIFGFKSLYRRLRAAFSDLHIDVQDTVVEGDKAAVRWIASMTHTGEGLGIPPTGERVACVGASFCEIHNGKITKAWDAYDITRVVVHLQRIAAAQAKNGES